MKKSLAILLTLLYLLTSSGVQVKAHYCHGKLAGLRLEGITGATKCCCKKNAKCCTERAAFIKLQDDYLKTSGSEFHFFNTCHLLFTLPHIIASLKNTALPNGQLAISAFYEKWRFHAVALFLRHRVLRV